MTRLLHAARTRLRFQPAAEARFGAAAALDRDEVVLVEQVDDGALRRIARSRRSSRRCARRGSALGPLQPGQGQTV